MKQLLFFLLLTLMSCSARNSGEKIDTNDVRLDFNLSDDNGDKVSLDSMSDQYLFVNFWATWCKPCIAELPSIVSLRDSLQDENMSFVLITNETPARVDGFLNKRDINLPGYYMSDAVDAFDLIGFPTTLVINPSGDVILKVEGADEWNSPANIALLKELISDSE